MWPVPQRRVHPNAVVEAHDVVDDIGLHLGDVDVFFYHCQWQRGKQPRAGGIFNVELERREYGFHKSGCADPR